MTRFEKEISGVLGPYWQKDATNRVNEYVKQASTDAEVDSYGAIRWKNNGSYLMDDYCEVLEYAGYPFSRKATQEARDKQVEEELAEYRKNPHIMSEEDIMEMRAAFGPGVNVVNVITGKEYKL